VFRRLNHRLLFILAIVFLYGAVKVRSEHRPFFLRPGLRLLAYVSNVGDGTVSAVDLVQLAVTSTIAVGPAPSGIRAHPTRAEIWGVSSEGGFIWVVDARSNSVAARIQTGGSPFAIDFSPDGKHAYVAASGTRTVFAIHCETRQVIGQARVGRRPWLARVSRNGKLVVVSNRDDSTVTVLDGKTLAVLATIGVAPQPEQVLIMPDSSKAFVSSASGVISVVDLKRNVLLATLPLSGEPTDLLLTPDTGQLIAPTPSAHGVGILFTSANVYGDFVLLGTEPRRAALTTLQAGPILYVSDAAAGRVLPMDFTYRLAGRFPVSVGRRPGALRFSPDERLLLVVNEESNDLAVIRRSARSTVTLNPADPSQHADDLLTVIPVGRNPRDLAILQF
jgi:YVTN family beta-propeller protein